MRLLIIFFLVLISCNTQSQPSFSLVPVAKADFTSYSALPFPGGGMSVMDFNNDGWDDITLTTWQGDSVHFYENQFGSFTEVFPISTSLHGQYYSVWIDFDNDGAKELFTVSESGGMQVFQKNVSGTYAEITSLVGLSGLGGVARRGGVFGDFNNDGLLDFYLCAYSSSSTNTMFFQDSNNVFQDATAVSGTANGFKRSFHAIVIDYNNDGLLDMYVANDFHDGNTLYRNNGDSTFTDVSTQSGTNMHLDAMGLAVGDYDGDLDLDIHITDRGQDSKLLRNNNDGTFTEVGTEMGVDFVNGFGWGNNFFDADQDGDEDLYVTTEYEPINNLQPSALFINHGSTPFTNFNIPGDSLFAFCNTIGDFNKDRMTDIAVHCSWNTKSIIWENNTPISSESISFRFEGCQSNRDAIGATFYAYVGGSARLFSIHGSQSFLGQNSNEKIVPLLGSNVLDSLVVHWPSGLQTSHYNLQTNQTYLISECAAPSPLPTILTPNFDAFGLTICGDDSILLTLNGSYPNITWSNGETSDSIYVSSAGSYTVTVVNQFGVSATSSPITIIERDYPLFTVNTDHASCFNDGFIELIPTDSNALYIYEWDNSSTSSYLSNLSLGTYNFTVTDQGECAVIDSVIIEGPTNSHPIIFHGSSEDAKCHDESSGHIAVFPSGGSPPFNYLWSNQDSASSVNVPAGNYRLTISDNFNCHKDTSFTIRQPDQILAYIDVHSDTNMDGLGRVSLDVFGGTPPYTISWNDSLNQSGATATQLIAGIYQATIIDSNNCTRSIEINVPSVDLTDIDPRFRSKNAMKCRVEGERVVLMLDQGTLLTKLDAISLFDLQGRELDCLKTTVNSTRIELEFEDRGVFVIRDETTYQTCKVVKL